MPASTPVRIVIVTLDNHLSGVAERAQARLDIDNSGIRIGFHAAADWDAEPRKLEACREDIARADIVIATMLFLDDHIRAILPALEARREQCDAMLGLMSGGEVVRLTRLGGYRMDAPAKGPLALLKKLRGSNKAGASTGAGQMKMLRRLPKMLRFIPGTAQDVRAYFLTLQYWLAGSDDNFVEMIRSLVDRYADGERRSLRGTMNARPPAEYPELGVYHPALKDRMATRADALPAPAKPIGTIGLLLLRSYVLGRDTGHYDGVIAAMEARGLRVIPAFASGLDQRPAIDAFFTRGGKSSVDAIVSLTGFSLVGGPAYSDPQAAEEILARIDRPYIAAQPLEFQTIQHWCAGTQGLTPVEATMMVAIPEIDGAIAPSIFGGRSDGSDAACTGCGRGCIFPQSALSRAMVACPERAEALAARVAKLVTLRQTSRAERKVAITLFNFPPNAGATGSAAFLAVFESLHATLLRLRADGYAVDVPATVDALRDSILGGNAEKLGTDANVHALIAADDHVRREPHLREIEAQWGPAPGRQLSDGGSIHILGQIFGNVFVGIQPGFGYEGDPMRLLFDGRFTPTHAFSTYYRWLREDFAADAVLHFGTHGALEFMPGKQAGLSGDCWPERLLRDLPNFYLYAANNPSEGSIAKRRSAATLISYRTPPLAEAGLYKGLAELKSSLDRWRSTPPEAAIELETLTPLILEQAKALDIDETDIELLTAQIYEIERALIPHGLHVANDDELGGIVHALDGGYIRPAPGGDIAANPAVLPTGRNMHGFDPFRIPSAHAVRSGEAQAARLLDRHLDDTGSFPQSIAMVLWGTDNLKSEGAQISQAMALIGARPRLDGYGRLAGAELIPLAELGRPRIDVIATLSGIFRDLLPMQTRMIAEAAWLAASADEPLTHNFIRKHALEHQAKHECDLETASLRVFSNAQGAYGANVNMMIDASCWTSPDELADAFEKHKGYAYGRQGAPVRQNELLKSALAGVDFAYQNLESVELGVTTIDHYVDALGGISRSVARAKGSAPKIYIGDETQGAAKIRTLAEQVALETRTRTLNPTWYEAMLDHGPEGVRHIECQVTNTMGWSATTGQVAPWVYQQISETFVLDETMRHRLSALNPKSSARMANRLLEACQRDLWTPDAATLSALHAASDDLEDRLEGVA